jgi:hypothetical protein
MCGNVSEWTFELFDADHANEARSACCVERPQHGAQPPSHRRVRLAPVRAHYRQRFKPAERQGEIVLAACLVQEVARSG